ncbi:MAG: C/D box methylation guide ribonucleoprotein complex aNOP56 subunit [Candidatus Helarchaeota archaeon]
MIYITETIAGIFAINEHNEIIDKELFDKDANLIAQKLYNLQKGKIIEEFNSLINRVSLENQETISVEDQNLGLQLKNKNLKCVIEVPNKGGKYLRSNLLGILKDLNFVNNSFEFQALIKSVNSIITHKKISTVSEKKDKLLCQIISTIDIIDKSVNVFSERLREWYSLHFPELDKLIPNHLTSSKLVSTLGNRKNFSPDSLKNLNIPKDKIDKILIAIEKSIGANFQEEDLKYMMEFGEITRKIYEFRDKLANYLSDGMYGIAPNISTIIGPLLAARLMNLAGGLDELAKKPSSTIQIIGAEQALFRSIRTGAKPPKHGLIFQWEDVHGSPWWIRGKISRALAGKLSIASRLDAFSSEDQGEKLLADLKTRISEIKKKYPEPKKKPKKSKSKRDRKKSKRRRGNKSKKS